jgi:hypothetical protein
MCTLAWHVPPVVVVLTCCRSHHHGKQCCNEVANCGCSRAQSLVELTCAYAACEVARESAALAFRRKKRGMLAGDVLKQVSAAFQASFPIDDDEGDEGEDQQGLK